MFCAYSEGKFGRLRYRLLWTILDSMKVTPSLDTTTIAKKTFNYIGITASIITIVSFAPDIYSYIFEMYLPLNQESQTEQRLQTEPEAPTEPSSPLVWPHYVTDQTVSHLVKIYQAETKPVSFYCGCDIFFKNNEPKPDLQSCAIQRADSKTEPNAWNGSTLFQLGSMDTKGSVGRKGIAGTAM